MSAPGTRRLREPARAASALALAVLLISALGGQPSASAATDPLRPKQWPLDIVRASAAWTTTTGQGAIVAVIDTGVDLEHEDLKPNLVAGYNAIDDSKSPQDDHGHGSHVAGIAAATGSNGLGVASVAPGARIMPVRALSSDCPGGAEEDCSAAGSVADIAEGIRWAADNGAHVINLSIGGDVLVRNVLGSSLTDAVNYAWSKGSVPVIAAGNEAFFSSGYGDLNAIIVVATTRNDTKAPYSNSASGALSSAKWALAAPGGNADGRNENDVLSTLWSAKTRNSYAYMAGTSMATPHVAGGAALLRSMGLSPLDTVRRLLSSAKDLGPPGVDSTYGAGRLDVGAAVAGKSAAPDPGPQATPPTARPTEGVQPTPAPRPGSRQQAPTRSPTIQPSPEAGPAESAGPDGPSAAATPAPDGQSASSDPGRRAVATEREAAPERRGGGAGAVAGVVAAVGLLSAGVLALRRLRP